MQHSRITAAGTFGETDPEILEAVRKVRPLVIKLAYERHKPWPSARAQRDAHEAYIRSIETDIAAIAAHLPGWTGEDLERTARADIDHNARQNRQPLLPAPVQCPRTNRALRDAEAELALAERAAEDARLGQQRSAVKWRNAVMRADEEVERQRAALTAAEQADG